MNASIYCIYTVYVYLSPQGMVDPGEKLSAALKREFSEEALNSLQKTEAEKKEMEKQLNKLFSQDHFVVRVTSFLLFTLWRTY